MEKIEKRVLVVDDDAIRLLLVTVVRRRGSLVIARAMGRRRWLGWPDAAIR